MNRTDTLLRLKRFRVDEMKRRIAAIDAMKADLERKLADLDDNVAREKQRAGDSDIGRLAFPSFLRSIEARRENLRTTMKDIEREHASAQAEMADAFQELKSLEIATEQQERQARYEQATAAREAHKAEHGAYPKGRPPTEPAAPGQGKPTRANTTDPDSRPQRTAGGFLQGFNAQAVVSDDQVVIAVEVVDAVNDFGQLTPMTRTALGNLDAAGIGDPVETVLADAGYFERSDLAQLHAARGPVTIGLVFLGAVLLTLRVPSLVGVIAVSGTS